MKSNEKEVKHSMIDMKKVITALLNYFPKDIYICKNTFIIGGELSENETVGSFFIKVSEDIQELFNSHKLDPDSVYYINGIRNHKDDFFESLEKIRDEKRKSQILHRLSLLNDTYASATEWNEFSFNDEELKMLFDDRHSIFMGKEDNPEYLIISKSMIPSISKTNYRDYLYTFVYQEGYGLDSLVVTNISDLFESVMIYFVIPV